MTVHRALPDPSATEDLPKPTASAAWDTTAVLGQRALPKTHVQQVHTATPLRSSPRMLVLHAPKEASAPLRPRLQFRVLLALTATKMEQLQPTLLALWIARHASCALQDTNVLQALQRW